MEKLDIHRYLDRIGLKKESPTLAYLKKLQRHHLLHIPFENLDIHYGKRIHLDYRLVYEKIISGTRGGYCYELNGLFFHLLCQLGYHCYPTGSQFYLGEGSYSRPMDHLQLVVQLEERNYLVDVGTISGITQPLLITPETVSLDYISYYRLDRDPDLHWLIKRSPDALTFTPYLLTSLKKHQLVEFMEPNEYQQDFEGSFFRKNKVLARLTTGGRIFIKNNLFEGMEDGVPFSITVENETHFISLAESHFGIRRQDLFK
ncbi:MAG: arylamine N-acetyltransferase [Cyclobacteriaceae bacterium]|nr:arylamine N-acetyltransferase [Cyclobacteriaceae bacterium]